MPPPKRRRPIRILLAPLLFVKARPKRALAIFALVVLIAIMTGVSGLFLWVEHHLGAARRAVDRGHNSVAIQHLLSCRRFRPDHPEVLLLSARVARSSGAWDEAKVLLDRYWELQGDDEALVLERLLLRATQGEVEATRWLSKTHIDPNDSVAPRAREAVVAGLLYRFRLAEAEKQIDRWLETDPDSTQALLAQAKLHDQRDRTDEALQTYRRIIEIDPEHELARMRMTTILLLSRQGEEALPHLEFLRRRLPDHPELLVQTAQALELQGRGSEARPLLDECLRLYPNYASALIDRGRMALRDNDNEMAEEYLRRAVGLDPGSTTARYHYSLALTANGKKLEADREEKAIARIQADVQRIKEILQGRLQEALDDPAPYHEVALIALRAGRPKEALRWLHNALQVAPNHIPTHYTLAALYHEMGNPILSSRHRAIAQRLDNKLRP